MNNMSLPLLMRDVVISRIFAAALNDKDILFISPNCFCICLYNYLSVRI